MDVFYANGIADGRATNIPKKQWESRDDGTLGEHNIIQPALIPIDKILLPPLHIKLGVVKNSIKCLNKSGSAFSFLITLFPKLSEAKIKESMDALNNIFCQINYKILFSHYKRYF